MLVAALGTDVRLGAVLDLFEDSDETLVQGFGFAWIAPDDLPAAYREAWPAVLDPNLQGLGRTLHADCWLVQSGFGVAPSAPQPFLDEDMMAVVAFDPADWPALRAVLREALDPEVDAELEHTDAGAGVFATLQSLLVEDEEMALEDALVELVSHLDEALDGMPATLSMVVSDGDRVLALRRAWGQDCAPMVFTTAAETLDGAQLVASQPLDDGVWQSVPEHHLLVLDRDRPPELFEA